MKKKIFIATTILLILNLLLYLWSFYTESSDRLLAECARNTGRTSAAINLLILWQIGFHGLNRIFATFRLKQTLVLLTFLFAINHLIHFYFVSQFFESQNWQLSPFKQTHGFITFLCLLFMPIALHYILRLSKTFKCFIIIHFLNITYLICDTFYSRYKAVDPAYLHRIGVLIMLISSIYVLYRSFNERRLPLIEKEDS